MTAARGGRKGPQLVFQEERGGEKDSYGTFAHFGFFMSLDGRCGGDWRDEVRIE